MKNFFSPFTFHVSPFRAFTLAEVLITLGIIGIVAALTIPTIIKNYETQVRNNQFKKAYSTLNNALNKAKADLGYDIKCTYDPLKRADCNDYTKIVLANLRITKTCINNALENKCVSPDMKGIDTVKMSNDPDLSFEDAQTETIGANVFRENNIKNNVQVHILADGLTIIPYNDAGYGYYPLYLVDLNGLKKPNKWGYDIFVFTISSNRLRCADYPIEAGGTTCRNLLENKN